MSAEVLRRAAALMRERAEAATREDDWIRGIAKLGRLTPKGQHMNGWPPAVALEVADWLDATANDVEHVNTPIYNLTSTTVARAIAVANTYLGESA